MRRILIFAAIGLLLCSLPVYGIDRCKAIIGSHFKLDATFSADKTVHFEGLHDGVVSFAKTINVEGDQQDARSSHQPLVQRLKNVVSQPVYQPWMSNYRLPEYPYSPQGDIRWPFALFGPNLAGKLKFTIEVSNDDHVVKMQAPGADLLDRLVGEMNLNLIKKGFEPVSILPVKSNFLTPRQALELEAKQVGRVLMQFPYDDDNPELTPHEVSYHLGAIIYPVRFVERANEITRLTKEFAEYLSARDESLAQLIVGQIIFDRVYDNDAGTAHVVSNLGWLRLRYHMASYKKIFKRKPKNLIAIAKAIDLFSRPAMQPIDALVLRLNYITGVDIRGLLSTKRRPNFNFDKGGSEGEGQKIRLGKRQKKKLREILAEFIENYRNSPEYQRYPIVSLKRWTNDFVNGLDRRIEQMSNAL